MKIDEKTAGAGGDVTARLKILRDGLGPEPGPGPGPGSATGPEAQKKTPEEQATEIIGYINVLLKKKELSELDMMQEAVLFMGFAGTIRKYDLDTSSLSAIADKYPLPVLAVGAAWVGLDKFKEHKARQAAKKDAAKQEPAPSGQSQPAEQQPHD